MYVRSSSGITTGSSFTEGVGKLITPVVGGERGGREFSEEGQIEVMHEHDVPETMLKSKIL